ncbi:YkgJ family cysteine cluster protein [Desulfoluna spongiiphila]|uniref:Putative zinc-or iron-chelating domain-containing protein n=1 Tax=Desulfoluna spongiiphila TaxID=419481 RepID=A0A1G5AMB0_9BACT|nr:YkgJ family cysteine cluster protein [Desulfoluna spongiiphila]SCX79023.1 Putative zinc-or iron-chelating domain-containing protein [Desulfoluna spongiiphila]VVS90465.1 putative zinc- or iron-chelating domain containing protein [Desulfoluna spongiiphila]
MEFITGGNEGCSGCSAPQTSCNHCGACCTGGGPVLRTQDERLIKTGKLDLSVLYTQRAGELMFNKETLKMEPLDGDRIKIKVAPETLRCLFLDAENRCDIYSQRPFECRSFKCWDEREIEDVYASDDPLCREDIIGGIKGLWDLVTDHHERCSYALLGELIRKVDFVSDQEAMAKVCDIIAYDRSLRETLVESGRVKPEILDFLFGRPLSTTIVMFNYRIENQDGKDMLVPVA